MMNRTCRKLGYRALLLAGIWLLLPVPFLVGEGPLTRAEVETAMAIREKADALRLEALDRASRAKSGDESFDQMLVKVQQIGHEADQQACDEQGIQVKEYRNRLRRLIAVGELAFFEDVVTELEIELRQGQAKTDADLAREADQTLADTEQWLGNIQGGSAAEGTEAEEAPAVPSGYGASLEEIVAEPMRQQAAEGELVETVRVANRKRIEEIQSQLAEIHQRLSTPSMRQAALDKQAVITLVDRQTLQSLSSSMVEEIPGAAFEP